MIANEKFFKKIKVQASNKDCYIVRRQITKYKIFQQKEILLVNKISVLRKNPPTLNNQKEKRISYFKIKQK